ncbi:marine proteobacterial sortase target protein [Enterovibrio sp. 27052020O]|uniref:marine proteobacterial sortase target protein n=1 Tax=Enterovibrio sp. 27052020O TaxID=3241166 RepID=UPI00388E6245
MLTLTFIRTRFQGPISDWLLTALLILLVPTLAFATEEEGGLYIQSTNNESAMWSAAPQLSTDASMVISGLINRVTVQQAFSNPTEDWVNARYLFPLPQNAAVDRLRIRVGERVIEGEIQEKQKARQTFDRAAADGKKASLIEQHRSNLFSTQVANIAPNETIIVEIEYQESLHYEDGEFSLRFPTTFTQRYIPGLPMSSPTEETMRNTDEVSVDDASEIAKPAPSALAQLQNGWAVATARVPDANEITPENRDPLLDDSITFNLDIDLNMGLPVEFIESATGTINVEEVTANRYAVTLSEMAVADRDFELSWRPLAGSEPVAAMFVQHDDKEKYGLLMAMPPQSKTTNHIPQNITFVLDTSGSMYGDAMEQAKESVIYALSRLDADDYFNLIVFNDKAKRLSADALPATSDNIQNVIRGVRRLQADGGTEMVDAITLAYDSASLEGFLNQVVFITDGAIGNEDELYRLIDQGRGDRRLFTVGIGSAPNSAFMQRAAVSGKGTFTHVSSLSEVNAVMKPLFDKLSSPIMKDINVKWQNGKLLDAWPSPISDLYQSQPLTLAFVIPDDAEKLTLTGQLNDEKWTYEISLADINAGKANGIDVLWARNQIESISLNQSLTDEVKKSRITQLGLDHHIVTQHTSLVAVDKTPIRPMSETVKPHQIAPHQPKNSQPLLQSGLGSTGLLLLGLCMILLSVIAWPMMGNRKLHIFSEEGRAS